MSTGNPFGKKICSAFKYNSKINNKETHRDYYLTKRYSLRVKALLSWINLNSFPYKGQNHISLIIICPMVFFNF
jgi:hypothetical protein